MLNSDEISVDKIKAGFGGYKKKATREFLDSVRVEYENLYNENKDLKDKISVLSEGVQYYKNMEKSLQKALVLAERTTSETVHAAQVKAAAIEKEAAAKAELVTKQAETKAEAREQEAAAKAAEIVKDAKHQADLAIAHGNEELRQVHSQIMTLIQQYEQYKAQYKQLAMVQMNVLESEAYTLEAPILKTIQETLKEETNAKQDVEPLKQHENVVDPVKFEGTDTEQSEATKMYVDGRGQVYEAHEFREVSSDDTVDDYFKDSAVNDSKELADDWNMTSSEKVSFEDDLTDHGDFFKLQESQPQDKRNQEAFVSSFETDAALDETDVSENTSSTADVLANHVHQDVFGAFEPESKAKDEFDGAMFEAIAPDEKRKEENIEPAYMEEELDSAFVTGENKQMSDFERMQEIERRQLEQIRQEERLHAESMRRNDIFSEPVNQSENVMLEASSGKQEKIDISKDTVSDKVDLTLHDLRKLDEAENSSVPLPKASEENRYFGEDSVVEKNGTTIAECESNIENKSIQLNPKQETITEGLNAFAPDRLSALQTYENDKNSIEHEMEMGSGISNTEQAEKSNFKSFRDFESEL